ncbi:MAG: type II secretion system protein GspD, partial [Gemmata sp.]
MFQKKPWNWKRVAANLLLVPVLTGGTVAIVHAQFGKDKDKGGTAAVPAATAGAARPASSSGGAADPKQLLKDGRKALEAGRFAEARDLAQAAEANNSAGKWGLFDDTPNSLRKDIQTAQTKAQKAQAEQLMKQAKATAAKPAVNDAERAYNLDAALQMARKADALHGPYSTWDMGDRPDRLVKELEAARAKFKNVPSNPDAAVAQGTRPGAPGTGTPPAPAPNAVAPDAAKQSATRLVADGRALADQGNFAAAKAKYVEADKLGAAFGPNEFSPGFALQDLNTRGTAAIDKLVRDARAFTAQKDYVRANAALTNASGVAGTLGLFPKPVTEAKAALFAASEGKYGAAPPGGLVAAGGPEYLVPAGGPGAAGGTVPALPPGSQTVYNGAKPGAAGGTVTGRQLLDQADYEFKQGQFETAARLALQAHNLGGVQDEARAMLNSIDAEKLKQKQRVAAATLENAKGTFKSKEYQQTFNVLVLVDGNLLSKEAKAERDEMLTACKAELDKVSGGVATAGATVTQPPDVGLPVGTTPPADPMTGAPAGSNPPGVARVSPDAPASQADALKKVQFQKLRSEGLKVQSDAQAAFGRGETDLAMQMLVDYSNRVRASGLEPSSVALLLRPVDGRLDTFRLMKGQTDAVARQNKEKREAKDLIVGRGIAEEERKKEVALLVRRYNDLIKKGDYNTAERVALQAKQLDADDPAVSALYEAAKLGRQVKEAEQRKAEHDKFVLGGLNDADKMGPLVTSTDPVAVALRASQRASLRGSGNDLHIKTRTPATYEIELKLDKPITVEFRQTPLDQAIQNLRTLTGVPMWLDVTSLQAEQISEVQLVNFDVGAPLAARNVLNCFLEPAGLSYVIESDVVKITTAKKAKGRLYTKVFSVADLVTPVPNFALPEYANFDKMLSRNAQGLSVPGLGGGTAPTPRDPVGGLGGGVPSGPAAGQLATAPGIQSPGIQSGGGSLQSNPLGGSSNVVSPGSSGSKHEQLIKLLTSMVRPYSWDGHGGSGKVEFFDIGSALVVNQTADVIAEVQDLLEALRRLQDLAIAVEVRIVSLAESFFERMGLDFSVNIKTDTTKFEPALATGQFRPAPFINDINNKGVTVGLTPAGTFTPDLDVPIRATSFQRAIPAFGNYPNSPGDNGGISLGLAFLNDIQVYTFLEMAQGDMRSNIMQAPKLTLFNGQTATLAVTDQQFFVTSVSVLAGQNGQIVFVPNNTPLSGPDTNFNIAIQAVVSADRRFVRLNLPVNLSAQSGASVPLFPVTTFITPVFEGGSQGQPIPFTQFLQQPSFTSLNIQTTVVCPDGGTVLLGGLKTVRENRNEFGPPFLSKIPYLNRLFKNVGVGRDTRHIMIMVTPRIIINAEEEIFQTEGGRG